MANLEVNLTKRVTVSGGLRYCPVVLTSNGKVKQDAVYVDGKVEAHPEGSYYIEWRDAKRRCRLSVGTDAAEALTQRIRKQAELNARAKGITIVADSTGSGKRSLAEAIATYLEEVKLTKKVKTLAAYSIALRYFGESCHKSYLEDVERTDLLKYAAYLRDTKELAARTVSNNFDYVVIFLKAQGIRSLITKHDRPKYVQQEAEVYEKAELDVLFAACTGDEKLWYEMFLMTGLREQEMIYLCWRDVNLNAATVRVSHKPEYNWSPKAYKEREVPIPGKLAASLKAFKAARVDKSCDLVFPTSGGKPKLDFLDCLKTVAIRAKLKKEDFWLHKFRASFATWHLSDGGVDLRTVQSWLGHSDLESTMRYLKPSRNQATRDKVNVTFA